MNTIPSRTKYLIESKVLPFEPSMQDILDAYKYFQDKYNCLPTEVVQEERGDCNTCLVFCRVVFNDNYDQEMVSWLASQLEAKNAALAKKIRQDGRRAQQAWKSLSRQERIARKLLGRHTLLLNL